MHMLCRDIAQLEIMVLKLHVDAIQSSVHYYQIYKKTLLSPWGLNRDVRSEPQYFSCSSMIYNTDVSYYGRVTLVRKIQKH